MECSQNMVCVHFWLHTYLPSCRHHTTFVGVQGKIEVHYADCSHSLYTYSAATVCDQLGCAWVYRLDPCDKFRQTSGEMWLDNGECRSVEAENPTSKWGDILLAPPSTEQLHTVLPQS